MRAGEPLLCHKTVNAQSSKGFQSTTFVPTDDFFFHSPFVLNAPLFSHHHQTTHTLFDNDQLSDAFPSDRLDCIAQFSKINRKKLAAARQSTETI